MRCCSFPRQLIIEKNEVVFKLDEYLQNPLEGLKEDEVILFNYTNRFKSNSKIDKKKLLRKVNSSFFRNYNYNSKIFNVLKKWFENEKYRTIYYLYNDSNDWLQNTNRLITNVMFNNRFLNMIQGLEHFHKICFGDKKVDNEDYDNKTGGYINDLKSKLGEESDLFIWTKNQLSKIKGKRELELTERLDKLVDFNNDLVENLFFEHFSKEAKDFRHKLSHGNTEELFQGVKLELMFYQSKFLLLCCILTSLNLQEKDFNAIMKNSFTCFNLRDNIIQRINSIN